MLFTPRYLPCHRCGGSVDARATEPHTCGPERLVDYALFGLRYESAAFATDLTAWLDTPQGGFARFLAARTVRSP